MPRDDPQPDDARLLEDFSRGGKEAAFRALVERYADLVYGTALRVTGERGLAEEVAQNVFALLARRAPSLDGRGGIGGWLHRCAWYEATTARRGAQRYRKKMEKLAREVKAEARERVDGPGGGERDDTGGWASARAVLDGALLRLPERDRQVLLLHYYEGLSFPQIAERIGGSAAALQKRGVRALAKLSRQLGRRGAVVPASVLATGIGSQLTEAAPAAVCEGLAAKALAGAPDVAAQTIALHALSAMKANHLLTVASVALLLALPAGLQRVAIGAAETRLAGLETANAALRVMVARSRSGSGHGSAASVAGAGPAASVGLAPGGSTPAPAGALDLRRLAADAEAARNGSTTAFIRLRSVLGALDAETLGILVESLPEAGLPAGQIAHLAAAMVEALAEKSPGHGARSGAALLAASRQFSDVRYPVRGALRRWALSEPAAAYEWFAAQDASGAFDNTSLSPHEDFRGTLIEGLFSGLFTAGRGAALELLAELGPADAADAISRAGWFADGEGRAALAELAMDLGEGHYGFAMNGTLLQLRRERGDVAVAEFISGLDADPLRKAHMLAIGVIPGNDADRREVEKQLTLVGAHAPEGLAGTARGRLLGNWARDSGGEIAFQVVADLHRAGRTGDGFLHAFIEVASTARREPATLLGYAQAIGDPGLQAAALEELYSQWSRVDRAAAERAFAEAGFAVVDVPDNDLEPSVDDR